MSVVHVIPLHCIASWCKLAAGAQRLRHRNLHQDFVKLQHVSLPPKIPLHFSCNQLQLAAQLKEAAFQLLGSGCGPETTETSGPEVNVPPPPAGTVQNARPVLRSHHRAQASQSSSTTRPAQGGISEPTSSGQAIGPEQRWGGTCWSTPVRGARCAEVRAPGCLRREAQGGRVWGACVCSGEKGCAFALGRQRGRGMLGTQRRAAHGRANRLAHAHRTLLIASLCADALLCAARSATRMRSHGP